MTKYVSECTRGHFKKKLIYLCYCLWRD